MRIRSDSYYIEHGMQKVSPGLTGRLWRIGGVLVVSTTWIIAAYGWLLALRIWSGLMAGVILGATWYAAAWFDAQEKK